MQEIKEELKKSKEYINRDKKDKSDVIKKFSELTKEQQKYIKEKEIIEQKLNMKEQELANNKTKIIDLECQIELLKKELDDLKKSIDLKDKENDELRNVSKKNNEAKIKRSDKIKNIKIMYKDSSTPTKIPQIVRKRDDEIRTFPPLDNTTKPSHLESINKYEDINLDDINTLINRIYNEITEGDNIVDIGNYNKIYFKDLINFLNDIKNGKINDFNKEMEYEKRLKDTEIKLANRTELSDYTRLYE